MGRGRQGGLGGARGRRDAAPYVGGQLLVVLHEVLVLLVDRQHLADAIRRRLGLRGEAATRGGEERGGESVPVPNPRVPVPTEQPRGTGELPSITHPPPRPSTAPGLPETSAGETVFPRC